MSLHSHVWKLNVLFLCGLRSHLLLFLLHVYTVFSLGHFFSYVAAENLVKEIRTLRMTGPANYLRWQIPKFNLKPFFYYQELIFLIIEWKILF